MSCSLPNFDLYKLYYDKMREEILSHQQGRDRAVGTYLIATSAVFSLGVADERYTFVLFLMPVLAFGCSVYYFYHHSIMGHIAAYLKNTLEPEALGDPPPLTQWDKSSQHNRYIKNVLRFLNTATAALFLGPSALMTALLAYPFAQRYLAGEAFTREDTPFLIGLAVSAFCVLGILGTFLRARWHREKHN